MWIVLFWISKSRDVLRQWQHANEWVESIDGSDYGQNRTGAAGDTECIRTALMAGHLLPRAQYS